MVVEQFAAYRSYGQIIAALVLANLLAALLYRLFKIDRIGEALAMASFLVAHRYFLDAGANLLYVGAVSSYTAGPAESSSLPRVIITTGHAGAAVHQCFPLMCVLLSDFLPARADPFREFRDGDECIAAQPGTDRQQPGKCEHDRLQAQSVLYRDLQRTP